MVAYASDYGGAIEFTSGEFDLDKIIAMRYSTSPYFNYTCYVSKNEGYDKREDRLVVSNECSEKIKTVIAGSGWFVGVDYSEFLSGIMYYPSTNGREFGGMEPKMVLGENCVGLFEIKTMKMVEGDLPRKAQELVEEWLRKYNCELQEMWDKQEIYQLPPL